MNIDESRALAKAARERAEKATPGPWESHEYDADNSWFGHRDNHGVQPLCDDAGMCAPNNSAFIAAAREDVPALCDAVDELAAEVDTATKVKAAWEQLCRERDRLWRDAEDKLDSIRQQLERNGCDCECEHGWEDHDDDCERCLACDISAALVKP